MVETTQAICPFLAGNPVVTIKRTYRILSLPVCRRCKLPESHVDVIIPENTRRFVSGQHSKCYPRNRYGTIQMKRGIASARCPPIFEKPYSLARGARESTQNLGWLSVYNFLKALRLKSQMNKSWAVRWAPAAYCHTCTAPWRQTVMPLLFNIPCHRRQQSRPYCSRGVGTAQFPTTSSALPISR